MKKTVYRLPALVCIVLSACSPESAYYMSPMDVRTNPYVTLPMAADSQKTITMASLNFQTGASNENLRDVLLGGSGSVMQSHHFGPFQGYYGAVFGAGNYSDQGENNSVFYYNRYDSGFLSIPSGQHSFGYYGFNGGINVVVPFPEARGEWRAIGLDLGYRKEFGKYLAYRKKLNPDLVDLYSTYDRFFSVGASTEILGRSRRGVQVSYKMAAGGLIFPRSEYKGIGDRNGPFYFSQTLAVTKHRVTGYLQLTAGTHAFSVQTGVNVSLRRKTQAFADFHPSPKLRGLRDRNGRRPPNPFRKRKAESGN